MIKAFLQSLIETGQPVLNLDDARPERWMSHTLQSDTGSLTAYLEARHTDSTLNLPGPALTFNKEAAIWGAKVIFSLSAATMFREMELNEIMVTVPKKLPQSHVPESHFSADICLRYLPDIHALVARIADGDPLLSLIEDIALTVPLSSVGMNLPGMPELGTLTAHPGLNQLHAERVITHTDQARSQIPSTAAAINSLVGSHRITLSPNLIKTSL